MQNLSSKADYQRTALSEALQSSPPFVSFDENGPLAGLCFCIALQKELGDPKLDRLSPYFGVRPSPGVWKTNIHMVQGRWAISGELRNQKPFEFRHPDMGLVLGPGTVIQKCGPVKWTIIPSIVAAKVLKQGVELGIVRDWFLDSILLGQKNNVYLIANQLELDSLYGEMQADLMRRGRLAFQGTHDIVDHLFGLDGEVYLRGKSLYEFCYAAIKKAGSCLISKNGHDFNNRITEQHYRTVVYTMGVLLDDLAQPRWYQSREHTNALVRCMRSFEDPALLPQKSALEVVNHVVSKVRT